MHTIDDNAPSACRQRLAVTLPGVGQVVFLDETLGIVHNELLSAPGAMRCKGAAR